MSDLWIEKYKPKKIKDIIGNSNNILKFNHWLTNFKNENNNSIVIQGYHGVGKNLITKIILDNNLYYYKWLDYKDEKAKNLFDDLINCFQGDTLEKFFINKKNKNFALIINDIEKIKLKNEKTRIKDLLKLNNNKKLFPIIFISNMQHNKLLTDILEYSNAIKLIQPNNNDLLILLNRIILKEKIIINDEKIKLKIIKFSQNDMRRLISILYDLKNSFNNEIDSESIKLYIYNSEKKCKDTSLFEASKDLIDEYCDINESLILYKVDKVLVPLTIHENFYKSLLIRYKNNNKILLNSMKNVIESISRGDVIETNIYTDQNWFLHDIHGFHTCSKTSYHINKHNPKFKKSAISYYEMKFSSDLNQTSLKNINKKQITNLQKIFTDKSFNDIINLNKIVYHLVKNEKIKELFNIMKDYDTNVKTVETIIKIDKTMVKLALSQKNKKIYNLYVKNKLS